MAKKYSKELLDMEFEVEVLDGTMPERTFFAITEESLRDVYHVDPSDSLEVARQKIMEVVSKDEFLYKYFHKDPMIWEIKSFEPGFWTAPAKEERLLTKDDIKKLGYSSEEMSKMRLPIKETKVTKTYQQKLTIRFAKRKPINAITDEYFFELYDKAFEEFLAHDSVYTAILQNQMAVQPPKRNKQKYNAEKMVFIPDIELHLGKLASKFDSKDSYDYKKALYRYIKFIIEAEQVVKMHKAKEVTMSIGNDFFNTDTEQNTTTAGTEQHNDTRFQQMISSGVAAHIWAIERMKQNCELVYLMFQPGNHDFLTDYMLYMQLYYRYKDDPKVSISSDVKDLRFANSRIYGKTLLIVCHGKGPDGKALNDKKLSELPGMMFRDEAKQVDHVVVHAAHYHNASERFFADNGTMVVRNGSSTGSSAWDAQNLYESDKTAQAYVYDYNRGLESIVNLTLSKEELEKGIYVPTITDDTDYARTIDKSISNKADDIVSDEIKRLIYVNEKEIKQIDKKYEKILKKLSSIMDNPEISPEKKKEILITVGYYDEIKPYIGKREELQDRLLKHEREMKLVKKPI